MNQSLGVIYCVWIALALVGALPVSAADPGPDVRALLDALCSDSVPMNGWEALPQIARLAPEQRARMRPLLVEALRSKDRQLRHYAAGILSNSFDPWFEREEDWPPELAVVLVEALRNDDIIWHRHGLPNARRALGRLYELKANRPVKLLREELKSQDRQARYCAAVILSRYLAGSVQPEVSRVLAEHLKSDDLPGNGVTAYAGLLSLGRENVRRLLRERAVEDWQQAAFIQCVAARFRIEWEVPRRFLEEWYEVAAREKGWQDPRGEFRHTSDGRVAVAALYLCPAAGEFLKSREAPPTLARLCRKSEGIRGAAARELWLRSRFAFLDPDEVDPFHRIRDAAGPLGGRGEE